MAILLGLILAGVGIVFVGYGLRMFSRSESWFFLFKSMIIILTGLLILGLSFDGKLEIVL